MPRLQDLQERREAALVDAENIRKGAVTDKGEPRGFTDDENSRFDAAMRIADTMTTQIRAERRLDDSRRQHDADDAPERRRSNPDDAPERRRSRGDDPPSRSDDDAEPRGGGFDDDPEWRDGDPIVLKFRSGNRVTLTPESPAYRFSTPSYRSEFRSFCRGERRATMTAGSLTEGGAMVVPMQLSAQFINDLAESVFIRGLADIEPVTDAGSLGIASLETLPDDAEWTSEVTADDQSEDDSMGFGRRQLVPHDLRKYVTVSQRLIMTSTRAEQIAMDALAIVNAHTEEKAFLTGHGTQKPLGVFSASADGIPTSRDINSGSASTLTGDGLLAMTHGLKARHRRNSQWIMARPVIEVARKLKDNDGQYLWRRGLETTDPDTLLGRPVNESEFAPSTITGGAYVSVLGDFKYYKIAELARMTVQRLTEVEAKKGKVGFLSYRLVDGQPILPGAFVRQKIAS